MDKSLQSLKEAIPLFPAMVPEIQKETAAEARMKALKTARERADEYSAEVARLEAEERAETEAAALKAAAAEKTAAWRCRAASPAHSDATSYNAVPPPTPEAETQPWALKVGPPPPGDKTLWKTNGICQG